MTSRSDAAARSSLSLVLVAGVLLMGCRGRGPSVKAELPPPRDLVATVDGDPIRAAEVEARLKSDGHQAIPDTPENRKGVLETLISQQAIARRAMELGLDRDPSFLEELRKMEVQLNNFRRQRLSELFFEREVAAKVMISDDEAKKFFDANAARLRTEVHVYQILRREEALMKQLHKEISDGKPFVEVARSQFPNLPEGQAPWDVAFLTWQQMPAPWRDVVFDLKPGETSGVIKGPKGRLWILHLVEKRENTALTFEGAREMVVRQLTASRVEAEREKIEKDLRDRAKIVYLQSGGLPPAASSTQE